MFKKVIVLFAFSLFITGIAAQTNENLYFVFLNTNPDRETISDQKAEEIQAAHLQNIDKLAEEGKLFAAGPFEGGGGMFILHAESLEQAKGFLQTDPAVKANRFIVEVFPFNLAYGNMCGAKEPREMVTYQLIRFTKNTDASDALAQLRHDNRVFMYELSNKLKVVAQGYFGDMLDGVVILDTDSAGEAGKLFKKHPAVRSGKLSYEVKTLWIARGTFCE